MLFCECHMRPSEADGEFSAQLVLCLVAGLVPPYRDSAEVQWISLETCAKLSWYHKPLVQAIRDFPSVCMT